jgi:hypothetical protein
MMRGASGPASKEGMIGFPPLNGQRCRVQVVDLREHGTAADQIAGRLVGRRHRR